MKKQGQHEYFESDKCNYLARKASKSSVVAITSNLLKKIK
jgi:hypothetical protein